MGQSESPVRNVRNLKNLGGLLGGFGNGGWMRIAFLKLISHWKIASVMFSENLLHPRTPHSNDGCNFPGTISLLKQLYYFSSRSGQFVGGSFDWCNTVNAHQVNAKLCGN